MGGYFQIETEPNHGTPLINFKIIETNRRFNKVKNRFRGKTGLQNGNHQGDTGS